MGMSWIFFPLDTQRWRENPLAIQAPAGKCTLWQSNVAMENSPPADDCSIKTSISSTFFSMQLNDYDPGIQVDHIPKIWNVRW